MKDPYETLLAEFDWLAREAYDVAVAHLDGIIKHNECEQVQEYIRERMREILKTIYDEYNEDAV